MNPSNIIRLRRKVKMNFLLSKELREEWLAKGFTYYHTNGEESEVFLTNYDAKCNVVFKRGNEDRMILGSNNLTIDDEIEVLIEKTRGELNLK